MSKTIEEYDRWLEERILVGYASLKGDDVAQTTFAKYFNIKTVKEGLMTEGENKIYLVIFF